jgi:hypothetical protein
MEMLRQPHEQQNSDFRFCESLLRKNKTGKVYRNLGFRPARLIFLNFFFRLRTSR